MSDDLLTFEEIPITVPEAVAEPPPHIQRKVLDYTRVQQEQSNWCWAAVTLAVTRYYAQAAGQEPPDLSQCEIVNADFGRTDCCDEPASPACNKVNVIYRALARQGHYADYKQKGKPEYAQPKEEIDADRPLVTLIVWNGGGGHFVALYGYDESPSESTDDALLHVGDPWYGDALVPYGTFPSTYQLGGRWGWSYWTQPAAAGGLS